MLRILLVGLLTFAQTDPMPPLVAEAQVLVRQLLASDTTAFVARFNDSMKSALSEGQVRTAMSGVVVQAGAFRREIGTRTQVRDGLRAVVTLEFERNNVDMVIVFDASERIAGFNMRPAATAAAYEPPAYVKPGRGTSWDGREGGRPRKSHVVPPPEAVPRSPGSIIRA